MKGRKHLRLSTWDYANCGYYFVTICTQDRKCVLGEIVSEKVFLSPLGKIIENEWLKLPVVFPNISLDHWVIVPNHLHGIIVFKHPIADITPNINLSVGAGSPGPIIKGGETPPLRSIA